MFERLVRIETKQDVTNKSLSDLNHAVVQHEKSIRHLEDTHLMIDSKSDVTGRVKTFLYTNGGSIITAVLIAYLLLKLNLQ